MVSRHQCINVHRELQAGSLFSATARRF